MIRIFRQPDDIRTVEQWRNSRFRSSPKASNFIKKESLEQVFSCEFCEIAKNNFFLQNTFGGCLHRFTFAEKANFNSVKFT